MRPIKLLLFVITKFFFCQKMPIIRLFVYPIKGAHGGTSTKQPQVVDSPFYAAVSTVFSLLKDKHFF